MLRQTADVSKEAPRRDNANDRLRCSTEEFHAQFVITSSFDSSHSASSKNTQHDDDHNRIIIDNNTDINKINKNSSSTWKNDFSLYFLRFIES